MQQSSRNQDMLNRRLGPVGRAPSRARQEAAIRPSRIRLLIQTYVGTPRIEGRSCQIRFETSGLGKRALTLRNRAHAVPKTAFREVPVPFFRSTDRRPFMHLLRWSVIAKQRVEAIELKTI